MLELILPAGVESQECFGEPPDDQLFPEEEKIIAQAVPTRRREFAAVRSCARDCLQRLGYAPAPILPGIGGAPTWPVGIRGSMTHCTGYAGAAVGPVRRIFAIGIDAEPDAPLPDGVVDLIATAAEQDHLAMIQPGLDGPNWDRLLFSAKEAVYKAWFPLVGEWLDHQQAEILIQPKRWDLRGAAVPRWADRWRPHVRRLHGRWIRERGILLTAVVLGSA